MTRRSPIQSMPGPVADGLGHPQALLKLGLKGPGLAAWLERQQLRLPEAVHDVVTPDDGSAIIARVDGDEIILEAPEDHPRRQQLVDALQMPEPGLYRIEQQSATFLLSAEVGTPVLAQTCGLDPASLRPDTITFTRVAGVSCGLIVQASDAARYRLWVDYSYTPYLWGQLCQIASELNND